MDVYHKVLTKIYEVTGGKETVSVDLIDLLKKEGFYSNIENIDKQLGDEGWVSGTTRKYTVKITHWGIAEAKRVLTDAPDKASEIEKSSARLLADSRELVIMLEEFAAAASKEKLDNIEKRVSELNGRIGKIREHL